MSSPTTINFDCHRSPIAAERKQRLSGRQPRTSPFTPLADERLTAFVKPQRAMVVVQPVGNPTCSSRKLVNVPYAAVDDEA
jgi:hypothetical protein